jgi:hypothetical protein
MPNIEIRSIGRVLTRSDDAREVVVLVMQTFRIDADGWKHAIPGTRTYCTLNGDHLTLNGDGTFELQDKWRRERIILRPMQLSGRP